MKQVMTQFAIADLVGAKGPFLSNLTSPVRPAMVPVSSAAQSLQRSVLDSVRSNIGDLIKLPQFSIDLGRVATADIAQLRPLFGQERFAGEGTIGSQEFLTTLTSRLFDRVDDQMLAVLDDHPEITTAAEDIESELARRGLLIPVARGLPYLAPAASSAAIVVVALTVSATLVWGVGFRDLPDELKQDLRDMLAFAAILLPCGFWAAERVKRVAESSRR